MLELTCFHTEPSEYTKARYMFLMYNTVTKRYHELTKALIKEWFPHGFIYLFPGVYEYRADHAHALKQLKKRGVERTHCLMKHKD